MLFTPISELRELDKEGQKDLEAWLAVKREQERQELEASELPLFGCPVDSPAPEPKPSQGDLFTEAD